MTNFFFIMITDAAEKIQQQKSRNIWSWFKNNLVQIFPISRRRRNVHSFSEELTLLTSAFLYNFVWSSFTFLASKVSAVENQIPKKNFFFDRCQICSHQKLSSMESIWSTSPTRCLMQSWSSKLPSSSFSWFQDLFLDFHFLQVHFHKSRTFSWAFPEFPTSSLL